MQEHRVSDKVMHDRALPYAKAFEYGSSEDGNSDH